MEWPSTERVNMLPYLENGSLSSQLLTCGLFCFVVCLGFFKQESPDLTMYRQVILIISWDFGIVIGIHINITPISLHKKVNKHVLRYWATML